MMAFTYSQPVRLCLGRGEIARVGDEVAQWGTCVLLVTGKTNCRQTGLLARLTDLLTQSGVRWVLFDSVEANPLTTTVDDGAALAREQQCDVVLGVGGGSVMDAAKGIAFMACHTGNLVDYLFQPPTSNEALPLVLVTTTAGTGSEGNCVAVFTNPETHDKPVFFSPALYAKTAIIDPTLMVTQSSRMVASTGFDALSHNIEARVGKFCNPMTEIMTERAIRLLTTYLPRVCRDVTDLDAWEQVCWANTLGGMAIGMSACGLPHAMEHPLSGLYNITHGEGLAALYPELMRFSCDDNIAGFAAVTGAMSDSVTHLDDAERARHSVYLVQRLLENIGLTFTLRDLGVREQDISWLADNCVQTMGVSLEQNPRSASRQDIESLYRACL
ncbi:iron-containing alcohol dehydrogenase [Pectobacterium colocasium]|uniref:iron-containing alcohol dehydrogenase n=1 Tax=Pectobacterium colocasium TaxID=2878098 RepID=UPI001CD42D75|nr:iron-containing alcohol dehydrogenase [Pectobacterium colocasium]